MILNEPARGGSAKLFFLILLVSQDGTVFPTHDPVPGWWGLQAPDVAWLKMHPGTSHAHSSWDSECPVGP